jgi:hypothetical protein
MVADPKSRSSLHHAKADEQQRGDTMTRERFLTVRWNNWISLGGGLVLLFYVVLVVSTAASSDSAAFIGLSVLGVLY